MTINYCSHTTIQRAKSKISADFARLCGNVGFSTRVIPVLYVTENQAN